MLCQSDLQGLDGTRTNNFKVQKQYVAAFSESWLAFLTLEFDRNTYIKILEILHKKVVPFIHNPHSLMDFLVDAYNAGGLVSVLALNGVFTLIHEHNLDYPHFYAKLYALFDSNLLHAKYRSRFFRLAEMFLMSTYIPSYLVAAFLKKMCRMALFAPPSATVMVLPLVFNLLKKHPSCITMIHKENVDKCTGTKLITIRPFYL
jgi:U3 small nucleolar RNA-associated protein 19